MPESRLELLFKGYIQKTLTKEEESEFMMLLSSDDNEDVVRALIGNAIEDTPEQIEMTEGSAVRILRSILDGQKVRALAGRNNRNVFFLRAGAAAAVVVLALGAVYFLLNKKTESPNSVLSENRPAVGADQHRAVLSMSDGRTIFLDSSKNVTLANGSVKISQDRTLLIFDTTASGDAEKSVVYNTLSTPPGCQYEVILPDGTKVWLNAGSSLNFPSRFTGSNRLVNLTGEAYFEVKKNKDRPFQVKSADVTVNVLGTHFNINAYPDNESIKTSLLEGSVGITKGSVSDMLTPGQQAVVNRTQESIAVVTADVDQVMAWKNGLFHFEGADIQTIMSEIGHWYDVQIVYVGSPPLRNFEGKISRNADLSQVLKILRLSNVKFSLVGKKIIVQ